MPNELMVLKWVLIVTGGLMALCLLAMLVIWPLTGESAAAFWGYFWNEFRWGFANAWRFQRDAVCAPAYAVRWVIRRDTRRRRLHRRQREQRVETVE